MDTAVNLKILTAALAAKVPLPDSKALISALASKAEIVAIASQFDSPRLKRELNLAKSNQTSEVSFELKFEANRVIYQGQELGKIQILYKSPLPGELQARLAIESAIDRFLEYLQKLHQIVVLEESDRHVRVFIPNKQLPSFAELWQEFLQNVAFSAYGDTKHQLPGLVQTFIQMLNSVTLSGRGGFSTIEVPILTQEQSDILASLYFAIVEDVKNRQQQRYTDHFAKSFKSFLDEQSSAWREVKAVNDKLQQVNLKTNQRLKLEEKLNRLQSQISLSLESIENKRILLQESRGNPFDFLRLDIKNYPERFQRVIALYKLFNDIALAQINSSVRATFTKCIREMYRLLENEPHDSLPQPLLTEEPILGEMRSPGDDSKEFCYSCGIRLDPKNARWQVLRFMFERPSQRRQSASSEGRPHICASCSALAFASPLKVTDESIILQLKPTDSSTISELKIKDYLRMLTNKEMHLSAGRYLILSSDRTNKGEVASQKMGQVQYGLAKAASIFPVEVLVDFEFWLFTQGSQKILLPSRHLIFIKGLMDSYGQPIINAGKDINMTLGDAVRYIQQDLPYLADYTLTKTASILNSLRLEQIYEFYWQELQKDLETKGVAMSSDNQLAKRARLYKDVAALTGITYAFALYLESIAKKVMQPEEAEREVSKLIEKVDDAIAFCYYATLGDETKKSVQARLYKNPDNYFIYERVKTLLENLKIDNRQEEDEVGRKYLTLYADDVLKVYTYFAEGDYVQPKDWNELTYHLKLSLYTRFPELVRKINK